MPPNYLTYLPLRSGVYVPFFESELSDCWDIMETAWCQVLGPGLKKLAASTCRVLECLLLELRHPVVKKSSSHMRVHRGPSRQNQLASHVSEPCWKWVLLLPVRLT